MILICCGSRRMDENRVSSVSQWLNSEIFIAFVVVLLLLIVALCAVCWILRCRRTPTTTERMAEIEIIPADGSDRKSPPRFILKIVTEEKHASELVQMLIEHRRVAKDTACSTDPLTPEVASTSRDEPQSPPPSTSHPVAEKTYLTVEVHASMDCPTTDHLKAGVTAPTESFSSESVITADDKEEEEEKEEEEQQVNNVPDNGHIDEKPSHYSKCQVI
ncbi:uncharacterized protein si:dkey-111e8.4 isoform X1 [Astyanax mexicanus]|uniref:uncharacterized protein si:dkey-111e8.4 isoform X1 n=2 Tax=Astyanax mexicanus TaxID=7994 RepID=UPI0020CAF85B|nr:uncharacterized protein si:dkey-111e8.4 isoform X1 [Astyanax mexicanus]